ncbi:MAG: hypothetical protein JWP32_704 [Schumannella sp.]|nr:hypothetical protein [Schumannella sp.]
MESPRTGNRGLHVAFGAVVIVALLAMAGCGTFTASSTHSPTPSEETPTAPDSSYTIEDTPAGFVYQDAPSGYTVTFPQRPEVAPLANNETDQDAYFVSSSDQVSNEFASTGQVLDKTPNLRAQLLGVVQSLNPSGQVNAGSYTLGGLDAAQAQFTTGESQAMPSYLVGQPGEIVVAGDGNRFYELIAIGGTSDQRQAFFDSFKRIDN